MLAQAVLEGYQEIWITGIHLATQGEYIEQRPQWEHLLGRILGLNVTMEKRHGFRHYIGSQGITIVLPESCPIMKHGWKYALEPKPVAAPNPYRDEIKLARAEKAKLTRELVHWPAGVDKSAALERLMRAEIVELDCGHMLSKSHGAEPIVIGA